MPHPVPKSDEPIITCLWFDGQAEEAAAYYTDIFDGAVGRVMRSTGAREPRGHVLAVDFRVLDRQFTGSTAAPGSPSPSRSPWSCRAIRRTRSTDSGQRSPPTAGGPACADGSPTGTVSPDRSCRRYSPTSWLIRTMTSPIESDASCSHRASSTSMPSQRLPSAEPLSRCGSPPISVAIQELDPGCLMDVEARHLAVNRGARPPTVRKRIVIPTIDPHRRQSKR